MWTPKNILLMVGGLAVFVTAYGIYAHFLGRIDGLPPLPDQFKPLAKLGDIDTHAPRPEMAADTKLREAFGEDCDELKWWIKLDVQGRDLVLAANDFSITKEGKVLLTPFSIVILGKNKAGVRKREINTVRSDVALLTFDQPIVNLKDIGSHKIIGCELRCDAAAPANRLKGRVTIVNNRGTSSRDDDLWLATPGPVYYQNFTKENRHQIWTDQPVEVVDEQSKPDKTKINANGMDIYLLTEADKAASTKSEGSSSSPNALAPPAPSANHKQKGLGITGVKQVVLRSDVDMYLWIDSRSGFLASSKAKEPAAAAKTAPQPDKALIRIQTQGPFTYDVIKDQARFDISEHPSAYGNEVKVSRQLRPYVWDRLTCQHLDLKFTRKSQRPKAGTPPTAKPAGDEPLNMEVESAHAWGTNVELTSDLEQLKAYGNDLVYDGPARQSVLSGSPKMIALKDGNEIVAAKLILTGVGDKDGQQAQAIGPGEIHLHDQANKQQTLQARWKDTLVSGKEGLFDVLTLTGDAAFMELQADQPTVPGQPPQYKQVLQADRLKVWLEPEKAPTASVKADAPAAPESKRRRPDHIEAVGHVWFQSPELTVQKTDRLLIRFKEVAGVQNQLPATLPAPNGPTDPQAAKEAKTPADKPAQADSKTPKKPIRLECRSVEADVIRTENRNDLEKLWCEGKVRVRQDAVKDEDRGVDIRGHTLRLQRTLEGNILTVAGDLRKQRDGMILGDLAQVQLDKLTILGPEVNIDQKDNKAWVYGLGSMTLPSDTSFQGGKLTKPADLTVHWNERMFFNGRYAEFRGGIQAEQDNARLNCQAMQVFLDRFLSLKEGKKEGPPPKVKSLVCDKQVRIVDTVYEKGIFKSYKSIAAVELVKDDQKVEAPGPGIVVLFQPGPKNEAPANSPAGSPPPKHAGEEELKLTRISYKGQMFVNNDTRTAHFYDDVELVHVPTDDPNLAIDLDKLPKGAMYLRADRLKVNGQQEGSTKGQGQQMEADGKALVQSQEFWGRADLIKYDEAKALVIFEGTDGNLATLYRSQARGTAPQEIKGKKIFYWRRTNEFKIEGVTKVTR